MGHLEHLETAFAKIAGDQWRKKTRIIDTTAAENQGKSGAEAGKGSSEKVVTIRFSGSAQEVLNILRPLISSIRT